jgi:acyl carrier protein
VLTRPERPTAEDVLAVVRHAVATVLELDPQGVEPHMSFAELGADSLVLVEVAEIVEERLAPLTSVPFRIPDPDLENLGTIGGAVDYALTRLGRQ